MNIGFTGTQTGMTDRQQSAVYGLIDEHSPDEFHHGDCVGADEEAHQIIRIIGFWRIVIWPPVNSDLRAYCDGDVMKPVQGYMRRNRSIVNATGLLIAAPKSGVRKGGTWATVTYAQRRNKSVLIVWPDGDVTSF